MGMRLLFLLAHDLFRKPVPTFRDHAPGGRQSPQNDAAYNKEGEVKTRLTIGFSFTSPCQRAAFCGVFDPIPAEGSPAGEG
jgi:hypothetical protein